MNQFDEIDNPERNELRKEFLEMEIVRPHPFYNYYLKDESFTEEDRLARVKYDRAVRQKVQAIQEQEVVDKRELIEKFAKMINEYKLAGEEIEKFAQENDIPGVYGWYGIDEWVNTDIIGDVIQWAASDHSC